MSHKNNQNKNSGKIGYFAVVCYEFVFGFFLPNGI